MTTRTPHCPSTRSTTPSPAKPAPKLALGVCAEVLGQLDNAAEYYRLVWATDPSFVSSAFGLARVQIAAGDRPGAVRTLESVPESSIHYTAARVAAVRARLRERAPHDPLIDDLSAAADQVTALQDYGLDAVRREQLSTEVLGTALDWVLSGSPTAQPPTSPLPQPWARGRCWAANWTSGASGSAWSARTGYSPGSRSGATRGSNWWSGPTVSAPGPGCEDVTDPPEGLLAGVPQL